MDDSMIEEIRKASMHPSLEVQLRSFALYKNYRCANAGKLVAKEKERCEGSLPWIDMLPTEHPQRDSIVSTYLGKAQGKIGRSNSPVWEDYSLGTEMYLIDRSRAGEVITDLVDTMKQQQLQWINNNGKRYNPPLEHMWKNRTEKVSPK